MANGTRYLELLHSTGAVRWYIRTVAPICGCK